MALNRQVFILVTIGSCTGILVGFLIGWFSSSNDQTTTSTKPMADESISKILLQEMKAANIEKYLRYLAEEPHIAGRERDEDVLVKYITSEWESYGFHVEKHPYDVLLSYPDQDDPNVISVVLSNGSEVYQSQPAEKILDDSQISDNVVNPFNAYSGYGDAVGDPVYVNYGRIDDFIELTRNLGVDPTGHVCIARYGRIFRGSKAQHAEQYGCIGLIIYSDPIDYTVPWDGVYPDSWYLPGTGAQRGNLQLVKGDPLTPQYPALDTAWRMMANETTLPKIPVTPIGYDDAMKYLSRMGGNEVPEAWKGGLEIPYRLGPGFDGELSNADKIKMHVTTKNEMKRTYNLFGYIKGDIEPDRYVLLGNHRDAWVFGAMDPSIGTATMLEAARSIGNAVTKHGWKPRRSIIVCNWGSEEYGTIGSTEWVEEFQKLLSSRAVAYLNVDTAVQGNYSLLTNALPNMNEVTYEAAKVVETPHEDEIAAGRTSLYDTWAHRRPKFDNQQNSVPNIGTLGSGSDYAPFIQISGISALHIRYSYDGSMPIRSYPVYHSVYETFDLVKKYVDPDFKLSKSVGQIVLEIARRLIDEPVLPLNCIDYAIKMKEDKETFVKSYGELLEEHGIDLDLFDNALDEFSSAAKELHDAIGVLDTTNNFLLRAINDQLMLLDRAFIDMNGIGERTNFRHVIYAPSLHNTYASSAFPGLVDSLFDIESDPDQIGRWREVERQYSILLFHIGSAGSTLWDVYPIRGHSNL